MRPYSLLCVGEVVLAATLLAGGSLAQGSTCWEPNYGSVVITGDDLLSPAITIPFAFPVPGGGTTTQIRCSTNGFVWLDGTSINNQSIASVTNLLADAPRICVGYADLDCDPNDKPGNGVYVNTTLPSRVVITFIGNDFASSPVNVVFMQLQLFSDGSFTLTHRKVERYFGTSQSSSHDMLVGVSQGGSATDPGESDFSAGMILGGTNPTIYELFQNQNVIPQDARDLDTIPTLIFFPNGQGSYNVNPLSCQIPALASGVARGVGCPDVGGDGFLFERFDAGNLPDVVGQSVVFQRQASGEYQATVTSSLVWQAGYSNRIDNLPGIWAQGTGDDGLSTPQPLGFTASFWDQAPVSSIYVCSNGRVFTGSNADYGFQAIPQTLSFQSTCVAAYSADMDATSASFPPGGGIYVERYPAAGATPARCVVTFDQLPKFGSATEMITAQVHLFANGDVAISTQANSFISTGYLGFFRGGNSGRPVSNTGDSSDLTTALVPPGQLLDLPSGFVPLKHRDDYLVLGTTPMGHASDLPTTALATVLQLGLDQTSLPLDVIGMTGCTAYTLAIVGSVPMAQSSTTATVSLGAIPNVIALAGAVVTTQVLAVVPGANPLQLIASNGWDATIGQ